MNDPEEFDCVERSLFLQPLSPPSSTDNHVFPSPLSTPSSGPVVQTFQSLTFVDANPRQHHCHWAHLSPLSPSEPIWVGAGSNLVKTLLRSIPISSPTSFSWPPKTPISPPTPVLLSPKRRYMRPLIFGLGSPYSVHETEPKLSHHTKFWPWLWGGHRRVLLTPRPKWILILSSALPVDHHPHFYAFLIITKLTLTQGWSRGSVLLTQRPKWILILSTSLPVGHHSHFKLYILSSSSQNWPWLRGGHRGQSC